MDVYEAVTQRRTIRKFKDVPVPYDVLERCVNAARLAPSGRNLQLCEYVIIDDKQTLTQALNTVSSLGGESMPATGWPSAGSPKAYIVILINKELETELDSNRAATVFDVGMAAENIILVAFKEGLGVCPILSFKEAELRQVLNIPDKYEVALALLLGFPAEKPVPEVATDSVKYWIDGEGVRHIPKRELKDIAHRNRFP